MEPREFEFPERLTIDDPVDEWAAEHGVPRQPRPRRRRARWVVAAAALGLLVALAVHAALVLR